LRKGGARQHQPQCGRCQQADHGSLPCSVKALAINLR
jgi:hypothetical protein